MERSLMRLAERSLRTAYGRWREILYHDGISQVIALVHGTIEGRSGVATRVQSHCLSAFVLNSIECDCREQMAISQKHIEQQGRGLVIWLDQDGRGAGHLAFMLAARMATEKNIAITEAYRRLGYKDDRRSYLAVSHILQDLDVRSIRLLSNNPNKVSELAQYDVVILGMLPVALDPEKHPEIGKSYADKAAQGHIVPALQKEEE